MNTREKIVEAAVILFLQKGYDQVSLNEIAAGVGIQKPSLYHYFKSKEDIFMEVVMYFFRDGVEWTKGFHDESVSFKDALHTLFSHLQYAIDEIEKIPHAEEKGKYGYYFLLFDALKTFPSLRKMFNDAYLNDVQTYEKAIKRAKKNGEIRKDIKPLDLVYLCASAIEGALYLNTLMSEHRFDTIGERLFNIIWNSVKAK
ncbi:MAG: TetR/AcrR family transcriptional regulator [Bacteroidales bacterium]|nr:MAG: TetR/AcrR family transcriptional regulator [Bacteroidales bacterium]